VSALPESIRRLQHELGRLPGIGPRSAERIALFLIRSQPDVARQLAEALLDARNRVQTCQICGALTEIQPCPVCTDPHRDAGLLCVVEQPLDILTLEKSHAFPGRYHVLGGVLSPLAGVGPEDLRVAELENRLEAETIREVVVALGTSVEGDATAHYLAQRLALREVRVTRIAHGLPAGSGLEYADEVTLNRALEGRREMLP
jgi:recombination protein RecR